MPDPTPAGRYKDADEFAVRLLGLLADSLSIEGEGATLWRSGPRKITVTTKGDRFELTVTKKRTR